MLYKDLVYQMDVLKQMGLDTDHAVLKLTTDFHTFVITSAHTFNVDKKPIEIMFEGKKEKVNVD